MSDLVGFKKPSPLPQKLWIAIAIVAAAAVLRCSFHGIMMGDSYDYLRLANSMIHFCYGHLPAPSGQCEPHWGTEPPGYPLFIAITHPVTTMDVRLIMIAQTIIFFVAVLYFAQWLFAWHRSSFLFHLSILAALFSPIVLGWSRVISTELLSAASTLWLITELLRSILEGKVRALHIAAAVCAGMLLRWDQICLLAPVYIALTCAFGWRASLRPLLVITWICAIPYLGLMLRAGLVGLSLLPTNVFRDENQLPPGLMAFYRVAALDQRATVNFLWRIGLWKQISYEPDDMFSSRVDRGKLRPMFVEFKELPEDRSLRADERARLDRLDHQFAGIAKQLSENFLATQIEVPLIRAGRIWAGWLGHPIQLRVGEKGSIFFIVYSLAVLAGAVAAPIVCKGALRIVSFCALSLVIVRTAFLVNIPISALEVRYLDLLFPSLDMIALCAMWSLLAQLLDGYRDRKYAADCRTASTHRSPRPLGGGPVV
jgi:hypothetical protein